MTIQKFEEPMLSCDDASCLTSHDNMSYVHSLNDRVGMFLRNWVYTEACMGKTWLDTHFYS